MTPDVLTEDERRDLQVLEERVRGYYHRGYLQTGTSLLTIQERRLYRETHPSFETYLKARFGMARATAYRFIGAVEVVDDLQVATAAAGVSNLETPREGTIRALVKVPHEDRQVVLKALVQRVAAGNRLTAGLVNTMLQEHLPQYAGPRRYKTLDPSLRRLTDARLEALAHDLADLVWTKAGSKYALVLRRASVVARKIDASRCVA